MIEEIKTYAKITNLWAIARRYFVNNFYDGMLTILGILLGFFVIILRGNQDFIESAYVVFTGIGTCISMFISGISGSYLSERAEQKKRNAELKRAMVISEVEEELLEGEIDVEEIEKAMLIKLQNRKFPKIINKLKKSNKRVKTLQEKAERFASIIVSVINGGSPFLGGIFALLPFFIVSTAVLSTFIISFVIILICIILLGVFLGVVSKESISKNILQMTLAFLITLLISIFLLV